MPKIENFDNFCATAKTKIIILPEDNRGLIYALNKL